MRELALQNSRRFGIRSLAVALFAVAIASSIAFLSFGMVKQAVAVTDNAADSLSVGTVAAQSSATKASAFEYKVGRFVENGRVQTSKCRYGTWTVGNTEYTRTKSKYGPEFTLYTLSSGSGDGIGWAAAGGGYGYDCGSGVYITGFKGSKNAKVVVPDKINGKPVVCICLMGAKMKSLDVSQCKSLKALSVGFSVAGGTDCTIGEIKFGKNPKLVHFNLDRSTVSKKINVTPANLRVFRIMWSNPKKGFTFKAPKLRSLTFDGIAGLQVGGTSKYLKELNVTSCMNCKLVLAAMPRLVTLNVQSCNLKKLDVSKNTKLKTINATGNNFNAKTTAALQKWQKAKKGRTLTL